MQEDKFIPLEAGQITKALSSKVVHPFNLHLFSSLDSTNRFLKDLPSSGTLDICCAEMQTQGRGRFGRQWHSPFGENIYCSSRWNFNYDISKLSGLSLVTSLAILATLNKFNLASEIKIKWPNDIYWTNKKLCGSLIEVHTSPQGNNQIIIGIGLNVNTDTQNALLPAKGQPWCSLYEITQQYFNRNFLIGTLINYLALYLERFIQHDLSVFMDEWNQVDYLVNKYITVTQGLKTLNGKACGINLAGQLILEDNIGIKHFLSSGDTSLSI